MIQVSHFFEDSLLLHGKANAATSLLVLTKDTSRSFEFDVI